jgi:hypothetical protein
MRDLILAKIRANWSKGLDLLLDISLDEIDKLNNEELLDVFVEVFVANSTDQELATQNEGYREELRRLFGVERLFICGNTSEIDHDGMPINVLVCPSYGSEGYAVYKKIKDYSTPEK